MPFFANGAQKYDFHRRFIEELSRTFQKHVQANAKFGKLFGKPSLEGMKSLPHAARLPSVGKSATDFKQLLKVRIRWQASQVLIRQSITSFSSFNLRSTLSDTLTQTQDFDFIMVIKPELSPPRRGQSAHSQYLCRHALFMDAAPIGSLQHNC